MNERIKELAQKAGVSFLMEDDHSMVMNGKDLEMFAELIVRECIEQCQSNDVDIDHFGDEHDQGVHFGVSECILSIKNNFGVEE